MPLNIYNSVSDILREHPQKNNLWTALDTEFSAEMSDFYRKDITDPWNRPFPNPPKKVTDGEGDVVAVVYETTVNSQLVRCRLFND